MAYSWAGKRVFVTGAAGTVGQEICNQLLECGCEEIIGFDHNESELFFLEQSHLSNPNIRFILGDICDRESLTSYMRGVDVVLHAAAYKHVGLCETSPRAALASNIMGVQSVIDAAVNAGVEKVLFTSSDKAVNPPNVMGTSKLMGERLVTAANIACCQDSTIFSVTRFGNVLGSRGSVIPIFKRQIEKGGPVTLTDPDMTRFIMTIDEAVKLVLETALISKGGEVFITKMPAIRIQDLAEVMIEELAPQYGHNPSDIELNVIGPRVGEKLYEELMNDEEARHALESREFFIILPAMNADWESFTYEGMPTTETDVPYNSSNAELMSKSDLREYLIKHKLIDSAESQTQQLKKAI